MGLAGQSQTTPPYAPQIAYLQSPVKARPGQIVRNEEEFLTKSTGVSAGIIPFGAFVTLDPTLQVPQSSAAKDISQLIPCKLPALSTDITGAAALGIAMLSLQKESGYDTNAPSYPAGFAISILRKGEIYVVTEQQNKTKTINVYVRYTAGAAASEVQNLQFQHPYGTEVTGPRGTLNLVFLNQMTTQITLTGTAAADATAIQTALLALSNIGTGNVTVAIDGSGGFNITFGGTMANLPQPQIGVLFNAVTDGTNPLYAVVSQTTQGTPGAPVGSISNTTDSGKNALIPSASLPMLGPSAFNPFTLQWITSLRLNMIK